MPEMEQETKTSHRQEFEGYSDFDLSTICEYSDGLSLSLRFLTCKMRVTILISKAYWDV